MPHAKAKLNGHFQVFRMVYKAFFHNSNWFLEKCEKPSKVDSKKRDRAGIKLLHCKYTQTRDIKLLKLVASLVK